MITQSFCLVQDQLLGRSNWTTAQGDNIWGGGGGASDTKVKQTTNANPALKQKRPLSPAFLLFYPKHIYFLHEFMCPVQKCVLFS